MQILKNNLEYISGGASVDLPFNKGESMSTSFDKPIIGYTLTFAGAYYDTDMTFDFPVYTTYEDFIEIYQIAPIYGS